LSIIKLLEILLRLLIRFREGIPSMEALYGGVDTFETENEVLLN
jgi:hypothetical protein